LGKVILQVSIAVFWALLKKFQAKMTLEKIGPYAYGRNYTVGHLIG